MKGAVHLQDAAGGDPSTWAGYAAQLLGAGGLGFLLRELVKRWFGRMDRSDDVAAGLRAEMVRRIESLEKNYSALETRERETFRKAVRLEAENLQLRQRWHALMNWMQSEPSLPQPPRYLFERVEGPTASSAPPQPPESEKT